MDALNASATANKKDPKKRKRRPSTNKDTTNTSDKSQASTTSPPTSPTKTEASDPTSPSALALKAISTPFNFYQDTLNTENSEPEKGENEEKPDVDDDDDVKPVATKKVRPLTPTEDEEDEDHNIMTIDEEDKKPRVLKSVLFHGKRKPGPKRTVQWKEDSELVEIQYFELDETERVNVTRNFTDAAKMELCSERETMQLFRKTPNEDIMEVQINWRTPLIEVEINPPGPEIVVRSLEKDIQFAREKSCLQALYFNKRSVPDSPGEPDPEHHQITDPVHIPLEPIDEEQQDDSKGVVPPWPEPKGSPPPPAQPQPLPPPQFNQQNTINMGNQHPMMHPNQHVQMGQQQNPMGMGGGFGGPQFMGPQGNFHPQQGGPQPFQGGMPFGGGNFMGPPGPGCNIMMDWNAQIMQQQPMGGVHDQQQMMQNNGPGMFGQNDFNNMHDNNFPQPFMPQQNQPNFHHNNFPGRGRGGFRRGGGGGPWIRMNGPNNWNNRGGGDRPVRGRGDGGGGPRICKNIKNHGYCRNRDNCAFYHPPV